MSVATFVQPNFETQGGTDYKTNIDNCFAVLKRLAAAFAPHEQTVPNMTVRLDAGMVFQGGTLTEVAAQNTGTITAPAANPRIDRVVIAQLNGVVSVITGTEAGSPVPPAIPAGKLPVAQVLLQTTTTEIINSMITDERISGGMGASEYMSLKYQTSPPAPLAGSGTLYARESVAAGVDSYTKLMLHGDGAGQTIVDSEITPKTVTVYGHATQVWPPTFVFPPAFNNKSIYFDAGGDDYLSLADHDDWNFGTGNFTIDFWVRFISLGVGDIGVIGQGNLADGAWVLYNNPSAGFVFYSAAATCNVTSVGKACAIDTWYHIAVVRNGGTVTIYRNGVAEATDSSVGTFPDETTTVRIGHPMNLTTYLNGYIDELRVSKGIARWTSNFTLPEAPYTKNTVDLCFMDGSGNIAVVKAIEQ